MPTGDANETDNLCFEVVSDPAHPLYSMHMNLSDTAPGQRFAPKRTLTEFNSLRSLFEDFTLSEFAKFDGGCSFIHFQRTWNHWKPYLKFPSAGQGKRCRICARLDERRRQATSQEERNEIMEDKKRAY